MTPAIGPAVIPATVWVGVTGKWESPADGGPQWPVDMAGLLEVASHAWTVGLLTRSQMVGGHLRQYAEATWLRAQQAAHPEMNEVLGVVRDGWAAGGKIMVTAADPVQAVRWLGEHQWHVLVEAAVEASDLAVLLRERRALSVDQVAQAMAWQGQGYTVDRLLAEVGRDRALAQILQDVGRDFRAVAAEFAAASQSTTIPSTGLDLRLAFSQGLGRYLFTDGRARAMPVGRALAYLGAGVSAEEARAVEAGPADQRPDEQMLAALAALREQGSK